jgi:hypothetical protein
MIRWSRPSAVSHAATRRATMAWKNIEIDHLIIGYLLTQGDDRASDQLLPPVSGRATQGYSLTRMSASIHGSISSRSPPTRTRGWSRSTDRHAASDLTPAGVSPRVGPVRSAARRAHSRVTPPRAHMGLMTRRAQRRDPTRDGESPRVGLTVNGPDHTKPWGRRTRLSAQGAFRRYARYCSPGKRRTVQSTACRRGCFSKVLGPGGRERWLVGRWGRAWCGRCCRWGSTRFRLPRPRAGAGRPW